jgi:hypothetical protein
MPEPASHRHADLPVELDAEKLAEVALALLSLTLHDQVRVWKSIDWGLSNLLFQKGWIGDPVSKAKSLVLTDEGLKLAEVFLRKHFAQEPGDSGSDP